ncbi:MAG: glycosyltransferase family 4 protein, partial [Candidatus Staskawiczbacteria bacterium]|nr:glycosyltransferase family 4 protein [Candidatus Staskawiczbacteria bacterium]
MKKEILIIGSYPPPFGGVSSHIEYLASYLVSRGYYVHIISPWKNSTPRKIGESITVYRESRIRKIFRLISHFPNIIKISIHLRKKNINNWREIISLVIFMDIAQDIIRNNNIAPFIGALLNEQFSIPLVVTNFGEVYTDPDFYRKKFSLIKFIFEKSSRVLASSQHCAKCYALINIDKKSEVINYGIDVEHFSSENKEEIIRKRFGLRKQDTIILFVGRMIKDMGLDIFIDSIPSVLEKKPDIKIIIVGAKGELFDSAILLQSKYAKNIFIVPDVSFEELSSYYFIATIVVVPTPDERACMGMAIKEAMIAGKPVIAANSGGIPEAVVDGVTGVLIPPK